ncbi:hypothetical protein DFH08DRAFT_968392 [Mycena albidolilacea]|uniref:Uncharacterized protein n=1 Tax=Mycena albidolilacea TaxID=1033008 RepID=A0AAD6ZK47_9AGAR|nr:hypothetical protein DFH08DRAFT_968392 [Mycena albidolilacea]
MSYSDTRGSNNDRQSVRAQIKGRGRGLEDNDEDVEIVSQRLVVKLTDDEDDNDGLASSSRATSTSSRSSCLSDESPSRQSTPAKSLPSSSATTASSLPVNSLTASPLPLNISIPHPSIDLRCWPVGLYVDEVVAGMCSMESPDLAHLPLPERFQHVHVYRRMYVQNTYNDAVRRWRKVAKQEDREQALKLSKTPHGLWTSWQKNFPLR